MSGEDIFVVISSISITINGPLNGRWNIRFFFLSIVPAVFPPNVTATALNTSAVTVSWSPIEEYFWQGSILGYFVFFNETNDSLRNLTVPPGTLEITITNLTAFTAYNFMVAGYTGEGVGQKSPEFVKKTYEEGKKFKCSWQTHQRWYSMVCGMV